jgi:hypothetical protein
MIGRMDRRAFVRTVETARATRPQWFDVPQDAKADDDALRHAEAALGVVLPEDYKWFLSEFGGGDFVFTAIYSADRSSSLYVVENQSLAESRSVVAFADNGCGDLYVFPVVEGVAQDAVSLLDHETDQITPLGIGFLDFVTRDGLERSGR